MAKCKLRNLSKTTQDSSRVVVSAILETTGDNVMSKLPGSQNLSRSVRRWRLEEEMAPPSPSSNHGFDTPENFRTKDSGEFFLLHDSGKADKERILVFASPSGILLLRLGKISSKIDKNVQKLQPKTNYIVEKLEF